MPISPENWEQVKALFEQALEREPGERDAFVSSLTADEAVRAEVLRLLAEYDQAGSLFSSPVQASFASGPGKLSPGDLLDGKFKIIRLIAEGGMGQVWLAEQTVPLQRQVVVKLIKSGLFDDALLQRFQAERQSLAIMEHPSIAKVFDAGATPLGQPFFVMEYVPGLAITKYCDEKKLTIRDRLELFLKVCDGVQHAHQKAIIHRDLKPANILVVEVDGRPVPRIIDFGIAKAASPAPGFAEVTQPGGFVGTPGYMSPEQTDPRVADVDTRTDVYSLGAILYVLLAGALPFDPKQWQEQPLDEMLRRMREDDPPRPSTKVSSGPDTATATAEARATDAKHLVGQLRGDLDWITMKALEKDRARRYGTPSELSADIRRHLNNEPVLARPASTGYRLRKYVRRHRLVVAVGGGVAALLVGFAVLQTVQLRRTTRERNRADQIVEFMTQMFKVSDPSEARGNSITAREVLDKASGDIEAKLNDDPQLKGRLMYTMAKTYYSLGLYPESRSLLNRALVLQRRALPPEHPQVLDSINSLAQTMVGQGELGPAEGMFRQVLAIRRRTLGANHPDTLSTVLLLADALDREGRYTDAEQLQRQVLEVRKRVLGPEHADTLGAMSDLGWTLNMLGKFSDAEALERVILADQTKLLGSNHPATIIAMFNLAKSLHDDDHNEEAERVYRQALDISNRVHGPEGLTTVAIKNGLADTLTEAGKFGEAETLMQQVVGVQSRILGATHPDTLFSMQSLSQVYSGQGKYAEAERISRSVLEQRRKSLGPENPDTLGSMYFLGAALLGERKCAAAEHMFREVSSTGERVFGADHPNELEAIEHLAIAISCENRFEEAKSLFQQAISRAEKGEPEARSEAWFNFALGAAVAGHREAALKYLDEAIHEGYNNASAMLDEDFLASLRADPRFKALVAHAREKASGVAVGR